jgi:hypothetical protein
MIESLAIARAAPLAAARWSAHAQDAPLRRRKPWRALARRLRALLARAARALRGVPSRS